MCALIYDDDDGGNEACKNLGQQQHIRQCLTVVVCPNFYML